MRVFVYYNLHKACWSIKCVDPDYKHNGLVIAHATEVVLSEATGSVSRAGRERVLREQRKNVHAGIVGRLEAFTGTKRLPFWTNGHDKPVASYWKVTDRCTQRITYDPYKHHRFVLADDEKKGFRTKGFIRAMHCYMTADRKVFIN